MIRLRGGRGDAGRSGGRPTRSWLRLALWLVPLLGIVAYLPLRNADYVQDDHLAVEQNPIVARGDLREIFSTSYWAGAEGEDRSLYRPVTIASFALERKLLDRPVALVSHAVNVLLHLAVSLVLIALALRLGAGAPAAVAAGLLFVVHPVHVEAVAGIVGRAEILAALFTLGSLLALSAAGPWPSSGRAERPARYRIAAWGAGALFFLALGSKETALAAPALMLGLELLYRAPPPGRAARWLLERAGALLPCAVALMLWLGLRVAALEALFPLQQPHPADNHLILLGTEERLLTALGLVSRAAQLMVYPLGLSIDYSGHVIPAETRLLAWRPLLGLAVLLGLVLLVVLPWLRPSGAAARRPDYRRCGAIAAGVFLFPYLVIGNLLTSVGTIFAERLLYLPSAGFCMLFALLLDRLGRAHVPMGGGPRPARLIATALAILLAAFSLSTWLRAREWRDDETVFAAAARAQPRSPRAHFILAKAMLERGEDERALSELDRTLALWPDHMPALLEKATTLARLGRLERAETLFREILRRHPDNAMARLNLAIALHRLGRRAEAERHVRKALLHDPASATAWAELGNLSFEAGRYAAAAGAYARAMGLGRPDLAPRLRESRARAESARPEASGTE